MTSDMYAVVGCAKAAGRGKRGWCPRHYERWRLYGDVNYVGRGSIYESVDDKLAKHVKDISGCWEWARARDKNGYGVTTLRGGVRWKAHRLAYETWVGPIPDGHVVRHKCDNPPCINPDHLETGTHADNNRDTRLRGGLRPASGDTKPGGKISDYDAVDIYRRHHAGLVPVTVLAREYGVTDGTIHRIARGERRIVIDVYHIEPMTDDDGLG